MLTFSTKQYGHLLTGGKPYLVEGLGEEDFGECSLTVNKLAAMNYLLKAKQFSKYKL
ncbi:MAG: hypothetical protein O2999_11270 [Nitrospirae bacterium]|nr:hypothetical protein [Nitrospirota bacterium]MDA1304859.1 hypothetical protein [Nitrospirota bacterium]